MKTKYVYVVFESDLGTPGVLEGCSASPEGALSIAKQANGSMLFFHNDFLADAAYLENYFKDKPSGESVYLESEESVGCLIFRAEMD